MPAVAPMTNRLLRFESPFEARFLTIRAAVCNKGADAVSLDEDARTALTWR